MKPDVPRFVQRIGKLGHIYHAEGFVQRAWNFSDHLALPNLSNSVNIGKLRYIQSRYETPECRNPDPLIHDLLSPPLRWLSVLQAKTQLSKLHKNPFYYYLIARTRYYDEVFTDAIDSDIGCIVNIGCGTDTRVHSLDGILAAVRAAIRWVPAPGSRAALWPA